MSWKLLFSLPLFGEEKMKMRCNGLLISCVYEISNLEKNFSSPVSWADFELIIVNFRGFYCYKMLC